MSTLRQPAFMLMCLAMAIGGGGFLLYVATAPDVVLNILNLSETQFGWMFVPLVSGLILGSATSSKLAGRIKSTRAVQLGFLLMAVGAGANLLVNTLTVPRIPWAVFPLTIYTFGFSLVVPVLTVESLDLVPHRRGLAASLQGFSHVLVFALISSFAAPLVYRSGPKHAIGLAAMMALSFVSYIASRAASAAGRPRAKVEAQGE